MHVTMPHRCKESLILQGFHWLRGLLGGEQRHVKPSSIPAQSGCPVTLATSHCPSYTFPLAFPRIVLEESTVKVLSSLKSAKQRHRDCKIVRRRGKVFVICKSNPRFKARQR